MVQVVVLPPGDFAVAAIVPAVVLMVAAAVHAPAELVGNVLPVWLAKL